MRLEGNERMDLINGNDGTYIANRFSIPPLELRQHISLDGQQGERAPHAELLQGSRQAHQIPSHWRLASSAGASSTQLVDVTEEMKPVVQACFDATCKSEYIGKRYVGAAPQSVGRLHTRFRVVHVLRVENPSLWKTYDEKRASVASQCCVPETRWAGVSESLAGLAGPLHAEANEAFLFHGTDRESVDEIWRHGFDERVAAEEGGLLGRGIYFAENSSKSDEYCTPDRKGICRMVLSRVTLGTAFVSRRVDRSLRRPPARPDDEGRRCDSVVGVAAETVPGAGLECYNQFVVYDRSLTYPELIVEFRRVDEDGRDAVVQRPDGPPSPPDLTDAGSDFLSDGGSVGRSTSRAPPRRGLSLESLHAKVDEVLRRVPLRGCGGQSPPAARRAGRGSRPTLHGDCAAGRTVGVGAPRENHSAVRGRAAPDFGSGASGRTPSPPRPPRSGRGPGDGARGPMSVQRGRPRRRSRSGGRRRGGYRDATPETSRGSPSRSRSISRSAGSEGGRGGASTWSPRDMNGGAASGEDSSVLRGASRGFSVGGGGVAGSKSRRDSGTTSTPPMRSKETRRPDYERGGAGRRHGFDGGRRRDSDDECVPQDDSRDSRRRRGRDVASRHGRHAQDDDSFRQRSRDTGGRRDINEEGRHDANDEGVERHDGRRREHCEHDYDGRRRRKRRQHS